MKKATLLVPVCIVMSSIVATAADPAAYAFHSERKPGQIDHVVLNVKIHGETKFVDQGKTQREKVNVVCDLEYDEKTFETPVDGKGGWRSVRRYTVAKGGNEEFQPVLRPDRRLICAEADGQKTLLFCPQGSLTRSELDLIEVQGNTLLWDQLLPDKAVAVNDTWKHDEAWVAAMFGLDEVAKTNVQSRLREVADKVARFEITGHVEGAVHGITTKIDVKGRYRFDRRSNRIDWLAMVMGENRDSSLVSDGIDAESVFQMTANPVADVPELTEEALKDVPLKSSPEQTRLTYSAAAGGWQFEYERRWYVFREKNDSAVFRLMDRGEALGQCNVSSLASHAPDKLVGLEEFQSDVEKALGDNFGGFVEASEKPDDANHRVLRVVAEGKVSGVPIQWVYYHLADSKGRQVAFVFTVEKSLLDRFADADRLLVRSLRFEPDLPAVPKGGDSEKKTTNP